MKHGCRLAWLTDPLEEKAYIYGPDAEPELISSFKEKLKGENTLPVFELDVAEFIADERL